MNLQSIALKRKKYVIGLMSGTSLDGVDAVLLEITGNGQATKLNQISFITYPFPKGLKQKLLDNSIINGGNVSDICKLNFLIAHIYSVAVKSLCKKAKITLSKIDFIGSHGQTIHHLPQKKNYFGYKFGSTLQIGDPSVVAKLTGILTVGDFRTGDIALGGEGAPLVPYFDFILFHSNKTNRALLNIGGISNITILNKKGKLDDVLAFDTGPGNMMIDFLSKKFFNSEYDNNGGCALKGKINEQLFIDIKKIDKFIEKAPPKSTGREYYGMEFLSPLLKKHKKLSHNDWLSTITDYTAYSVYRNYEKFIKSETKIEELFISGGGAKNKFVMNSLKKYFGKKIQIKNAKDLGISPDAKEAICFAVLANETLSGNPNNIPKVTGASRKTILGKICLP